MRSAFTSSMDKTLFTPFTSSLPNGWQLKHAGQESNGLFTFQESALIPLLQPVYVEDVAEAIAQLLRRPETPSTIFEFGGPRVYSYAEFLRAVARQAGLA